MVLDARLTRARRVACDQVAKSGASDSVHDFIAQARTTLRCTGVHRLRPECARHVLPRQDVAKHPVLVFMKGTPTAPMCGFSNMVCRVLDQHGAWVPASTRIGARAPTAQTATGLVTAAHALRVLGRRPVRQPQRT